jgi:hypothetical protein
MTEIDREIAYLIESLGKLNLSNNKHLQVYKAGRRHLARLFIEKAIAAQLLVVGNDFS